MTLSRTHWLILEPYYGGSHRALVDGLCDRVPVDFTVWTLPPRKWKWRMRGAALHFARRWESEPPSAPDGIFVTSLLDAASLRGLLPDEAKRLPLVLYFHENQMAYPVREEKERDFHYPWANLQSALAADRVLWNSAFNRDSFLDALPGFLRRLPDARPRGVPAAIRERSEVLPVPIDAEPFIAADTGDRRQGPARIVWNHRWEHDKGPATFFRALETLAGTGRRFEVSVLGERFARTPRVFERARASLGDRVVHWGRLEDRHAYAGALAEADFVVSTSRHEFQGLAVLEAAAAGAVPLVPDGLAYPEIWPEEVRYRRGDLGAALGRRLEELDHWRGWGREGRGRAVALRFGWRTLAPRWTEVFSGGERGSVDQAAAG